MPPKLPRPLKIRTHARGKESMCLTSVFPSLPFLSSTHSEKQWEKYPNKKMKHLTNLRFVKTQQVYKFTLGQTMNLNNLPPQLLIMMLYTHQKISQGSSWLNPIFRKEDFNSTCILTPPVSPLSGGLRGRHIPDAGQTNNTSLQESGILNLKKYNTDDNNT